MPNIDNKINEITSIFREFGLDVLPHYPEYDYCWMTATFKNGYCVSVFISDSDKLTQYEIASIRYNFKSWDKFVSALRQYISMLVDWEVGN